MFRLLLIGLPWTLFLDSLGMVDFYSGVSPTVLTVLAPMINLAILFSICSSCTDANLFEKPINYAMLRLTTDSAPTKSTSLIDPSRATSRYLGLELALFPDLPGERK